jgi:hypothetical protein
VQEAMYIFFEDILSMRLPLATLFILFVKHVKQLSLNRVSI